MNEFPAEINMHILTYVLQCHNNINQIMGLRLVNKCFASIINYTYGFNELNSMVSKIVDRNMPIKIAFELIRCKCVYEYLENNIKPLCAKILLLIAKKKSRFAYNIKIRKNIKSVHGLTIKIHKHRKVNKKVAICKFIILGHLDSIIFNYSDVLSHNFRIARADYIDTLYDFIGIMIKKFPHLTKNKVSEIFRHLKSIKLELNEINNTFY